MTASVSVFKIRTCYDNFKYIFHTKQPGAECLEGWWLFGRGQGGDLIFKSLISSGHFTLEKIHSDNKLLKIIKVKKRKDSFSSMYLLIKHFFLILYF